MATRRYAVHAFLIKTEGKDVASRNAITRFSEQPLYAVCRMKAKSFSMGAAKDFVDLFLQRDIHRVPRFFDDWIEHYEPRAALQYPKHLLHDALRVGKMMQAKGNQGAVESVGFEWQRIGFACALPIVGNSVDVLMTDIEHCKCLIYTDDPAALDMFSNRPSSTSRACSQVKYYLIAIQRQHFYDLFRERIADAR